MIFTNVLKNITTDYRWLFSQIEKGTAPFLSNKTANLEIKTFFKMKKNHERLRKFLSEKGRTYLDFFLNRYYYLNSE